MVQVLVVKYDRQSTPSTPDTRILSLSTTDRDNSWLGCVRSLNCEMACSILQIALQINLRHLDYSHGKEIAQWFLDPLIFFVTSRIPTIVLLPFQATKLMYQSAQSEFYWGNKHCPTLSDLK